MWQCLLKTTCCADNSMPKKPLGTSLTDESTLLLGEPNITVKVYINLTGLLIITINIKANRIKSFTSSHPVKFPLDGIRSLRFCNQPNFYITEKTLVITL